MHASSKALHWGFFFGLKHKRWIFLASALWALPACETLSFDDSESFNEELDEAADPVRQALALNASLANAESALEAKDYQRAYEVLQRHMILYPATDATKLLLARTYLGRKEGRNTQTILDSMTEEARETPQAHLVRGLALLIIGDLPEATEQLELALAQDPSLWRAANGLGLIHDFEQRWDEAEASYRRALEIKTNSAMVQNNLGYSYLLQGRVDEATKAFTDSLSDEPDLIVARSNLRLALAAKGRYTAAIAGTDRAHMPQVLNNIGYVAMLRGDFVSADTFFNRAIDESPVYYDAAEENLERLQVIMSDQIVDERPLGSTGN